MLEPLLIKRYPATVLPAHKVSPGIRQAELLGGWKARVVRTLILVNIILLALSRYGSHRKALAAVRELDKLRLRFRKKGSRPRYLFHGGRFFVNLNTPGWPSRTFNRFVTQQFRKIDGEGPTLSLVLLAITKKCGFRCEHCFEWENLNKPETLSGTDLNRILQRFLGMGASQVQLSGGEPLNRFAALTGLLAPLRGKMDTWLYTTGYALTRERAFSLKRDGLTGVVISIDDHRAEHHDNFRGVPGAWNKAMHAVETARNAGLLVAYSCCATRSFVSLENLWAYLRFAGNSGADFVQFLEPRAVGHYAGRDVELGAEQRAILEDFYESIDKGPERWSRPIVSFHGYHARKSGCSGRARDYVYVDTDGDVHACPFCSRKLFSALDEDLVDKMETLRASGCSVPAYDEPKKQTI
jgi:MoaA/NifB/PqqE/SkfB family radical SAM enzyme